VKDQNAGNALLSKVIAERHPDTADLLEYSTDTVRPLIELLYAQGARMRILVKHPEEGVGDVQQVRIYNGLRYLRQCSKVAPTACRSAVPHLAVTAGP
jgi:hypothetical protein